MGAIRDAAQEATTGSRWQPYPAYKPSGVEWLGDIPAHWEVERLKWTVISCINGVWGVDPDGEYDLVCVRVADFDRVRFRINLENPTLRSIPEQQRNGRLLRRGDLLLEKSGGGEQQPVGAVMLYDSDVPAVCSNFIARMAVASGFLPEFLVHLHAALYSARIHTRSIKQTTGIQNLDSSSYLNERVGLPPLDEQRAIATFLDRETARIDALIARKQRLIELLREKRTALISHAVTKGLDPNAPMKDSGVEWLGEIPAHWKVLKGAYFLKIFGGYAPEGLVYSENGCNYYKVDDLNYEGDGMFLGHARQSVSTEYSVAPIAPPLILIPKRGAAIATNKVRLAAQRCIFDSNIMGLKPLSECDLKFFAFTLLSRRLWDIADVSTIPQINNKHIYQMRFPIPPVLEQEAIVTELESQTARIDAVVRMTWSAIDKLREYRAALISAAVTGKIDVRGT